MSNFKTILKSHKDGQGATTHEVPPPSPAPPVEGSEPAKAAAKGVPAKSAKEPKKRGRPSGKRSNEAYVQVTAWILGDTHHAVKSALLNDRKGQEFSELVEDLLSKWLRSRTRNVKNSDFQNSEYSES